MYNLVKKITQSSADVITAKLAFGVALFAIALTLSMQNTPCLSASSCVVGASEEFSGTVKINSGNTYGHTLTGNAQADRTLTLPDVSGELFVAAFTGNNNKLMQVNSTGTAASYDFVDPLTQIDVTSGGTQTPTSGQVMQVNSAGNALTFGNVGIANINDSGVAGQFLKSSGSALSFSKIDLTDSTQIDLVGSPTSGQILTVNQTATALEFANMPASAGSFQATAAQNVVAGTVGMETNGQIRNITTLQNGSNSLKISNHSSPTNATVYTTFSFYNSNIDGQIVFYKDYDTANTSTCDTHFYVDVIVHASSTLSNWGRQCVSNDWSTIAASYPMQNTTEMSANGEGHFRVKRYGLEHDETLNDYVVVFKEENSSSGQMFAVPVSINPSNNTLVVGTWALIHNEHVCYNNGSCSSNNTSHNLSRIHDMAFAAGQDDKMYIWWSIYHNNSWNANNYSLSHKAFSCSNLGATNASCSPNNNHKYTTSTNYFKQYSSGNNPEIVWDNTAQAFIGFDDYWNYNCRFAQFQLHEGTYNSMNFGTYGNSSQQVWSSGSTYQDQDGNNFNISQPISCHNSNYSEAVYDPDLDAWLFPVVASKSYNNYDQYQTVHIVVSGNTSNYTGAVTVHGYSNFNTALGIYSGATECQTAANLKCKAENFITDGSAYYDTTADKWYSYHRKIQQGTEAPFCNDGYSSQCLAVYEWEMDSTTKLLDTSTLKEYVYQPVSVDSVWNQIWNQRVMLYKDKGDNVIIAGYHHGATATTPSEAYHFMAKAFVIPDNIGTLIGYATQGGNQGASITVYSIGAVIDGLNGLTIGTEYFVKDDGSLGTSGTYKIGRAIATDKIYITSAR
tara:strand:+ start:10615 stop:13149 length:2535 start_codon:yes stop_codon:yes gene_type:complete